MTGKTAETMQAEVTQATAWIAHNLASRASRRAGRAMMIAGLSLVGSIVALIVTIVR